MGYVELSGTDQTIAQGVLKDIMDREGVVTMLIMGRDHESVAADAKEVAEGTSPSSWFAVWVKNPRLLTEQQRKDYTLGREGVVLCVLSRDDRPTVWLTEEYAKYKDQLLYAFEDAEQGVKRIDARDV